MWPSTGVEPGRGDGESDWRTAVVVVVGSTSLGITIGMWNVLENDSIVVTDEWLATPSIAKIPLATVRHSAQTQINYVDGPTKYKKHQQPTTGKQSGRYSGCKNEYIMMKHETIIIIFFEIPLVSLRNGSLKCRYGIEITRNTKLKWSFRTLDWQFDNVCRAHVSPCVSKKRLNLGLCNFHPTESSPSVPSL